MLPTLTEFVPSDIFPLTYKFLHLYEFLPKSVTLSAIGASQLFSPVSLCAILIPFVFNGDVILNAFPSNSDFKSRVVFAPVLLCSKVQGLLVF